MFLRVVISWLSLKVKKIDSAWVGVIESCKIKCDT